MHKLRIGIVFGGRSAEHEVSILSARNILQLLDPRRFIPVLIGIDKSGRWFKAGRSQVGHCAANPKLLTLHADGPSLAVRPGSGKHMLVAGSRNGSETASAIDVIFPVLHGPFGEDGTVQGLLKLADVPFVGPGVLGSAVGMDKDIMKRLFEHAGIPTAEYIAGNARHTPSYDAIVRTIGSPFFIKPANLGSSVGIHKIRTRTEYTSGLSDAFRYDTKVIAEKNIRGRELECSVIGNEEPVASIPGEVIPSSRHAFYSYEAKYVDDQGAKLIIPAQLPKSVVRQVQAMALRAFTALGLEGMARVDFFLQGKHTLLVNEVNTIPGFTPISMYPKLWEASGISQRKLVTMLIDLAIARHRRDMKLRTTVV